MAWKLGSTSGNGPLLTLLAGNLIRSMSAGALIVLIGQTSVTAQPATQVHPPLHLWKDPGLPVPPPPPKTVSGWAVIPSPFDGAGRMFIDASDVNAAVDELADETIEHCDIDQTNGILAMKNEEAVFWPSFVLPRLSSIYSNANGRYFDDYDGVSVIIINERTKITDPPEIHSRLEISSNRVAGSEKEIVCEYHQDGARRVALESAVEQAFPGRLTLVDRTPMGIKWRLAQPQNKLWPHGTTETINISAPGEGDAVQADVTLRLTIPEMPESAAGGGY